MNRTICFLMLFCSAFAFAPVANAAGIEKLNWSQQGERGPDVPAFWVRPGYKVTLIAKDQRNARFLEVDDKGNLYLSRPNRGEIASFKPDGSGGYQQWNTFISDKKTAHGMQWKDGWLYFTQSGSISRARDTNNDGKADEVVDVIPGGQLAEGGGHWFRTILVTSSSLYTSIGDDGNLNDVVAKGRETIFEFNTDGTNRRVFATGLRNTEKLLVRPGTTEIWGCDHGSDWYGKPIGDKEGLQPVTDMNPPDEMNLYVNGGFYGHPYVVGDKLPRIEFQGRKNIIELADKTIPPAWSFNAHWAVNGWCFITKDQFGADHNGDAFCALHGSWNAKRRTGYRIERILFDKVNGRPYGSMAIVSALGKDGNVLARPVDCCETADGNVLFSCDQTGRIYRISKSAAQ